jgi:hypothetical protein
MKHLFYAQYISSLSYTFCETFTLTSEKALQLLTLCSEKREIFHFLTCCIGTRRQRQSSPCACHVELHAFLTSTLESGEWTASRLRPLYFRGKTSLGTHCIGCWVCQKSLTPARNRTTILPAHNLITVPTELPQLL